MSDVQNREPQEAVRVINASKKTVFEQLNFLVNRLGNPLLTKDLVDRESDTIAKRHDIKSGDMIPYIDPDGYFTVLGNNIDPNTAFNTIVHLFGSLTGLDVGTDVKLEYVELTDDNNAQAFKASIAALIEMRDNVEKYFEHVTVVQSTPEELVGLIQQAKSDMVGVDFEQETLTVVNLNDLSGRMFDISSVDEVVPGTALMGEVGLEENRDQQNDKREMLFIGSAIDNDQLIRFLTNMVEGMGVGLFLGFNMSITTYSFEDYMRNSIINPD